MRIRRLSLALVVAASVALGLPSAEACSCVGPSSLVDDVGYTKILFVGTVTAVEVPRSVIRMPRDGTVPPPPDPPPPETAVFAVERTFRGEVDRVVRLRSDGTNCSFTFKRGERWLIYASRRDGRVETGKCSRTRLVAHARADLDYIEGLASGRPQGIVFGDLSRRGIGRDGLPGLFPSYATASIVAVLADGLRREFETHRGSYELVLPPGPVTVWVERQGQPLSSPISLVVADRGEHRAAFVLEHDER